MSTLNKFLPVVLINLGLIQVEHAKQAGTRNAKILEIILLVSHNSGSGSGPEPIFHDCFINRSENTVFIEKLVSKHENSFESKILEKRASSNSIAEPMPPSVK